MLICKPIGRGNWCPIVIRIEQSRNAPRPMDFHRGQIIQFGGQTLRVCVVMEGS